MPHVYILECSDGSFYTGSTFVLERRLAQHQRGEGANYTAKRRPVRIVWAEEFAMVRDAYEMEKRIQGWSRAKKRALIEGRLEDLVALSQRSNQPPHPEPVEGNHPQSNTRFDKLSDREVPQEDNSRPTAP